MALLFLYACTCPTPLDDSSGGGTSVPLPAECSGETTFDGPDTSSWLFGEGADVTVNAIELDFPAASAAKLRALDDGTDEYVCATLTTPYGVLADVGVRLRGKKWNSFQPFDGKPYLEVATDHYVDGQTLSGLAELRLYNQWEDQSGLQRYLGYQLWRDAGYPAPRAGFATLTIDGRDVGLYGTGEGIQASMLNRAEWDEFFPNEVDDDHIYEGEYGNDLTGSWVDHIDDLEDEDALRDLADIVEHSADLEADLPGRMDTTIWHQHWALEMVVGAREGYSFIQNNWFLVADPTSGRATMIPWGFDQVLVDRNLMPDNPAGLLPLRGSEQSGFFEKQCEALGTALNAVDWEGLRDDLAALNDLEALSPALAIEDVDRYHPVEIRQQRAEIDAYLQERPLELTAWYDAHCQ